MSPVPDLLTVEEVARLLRIGRTKAYALTQEWRATGGKSGIKVIEIGGQLRVPRVWLEELMGAPIEFIPDPPPPSKTKKPSAPKSNSKRSASDSTTSPDANKNKKRRAA